MKSKIRTMSKREELLCVRDRIRNQQRSIDKKCREIETQIINRTTGKNNVSSFDVENLLSRNNDRTLSSLQEQLATLKKAKKLPLYADAEYRQLSIQYLTEIAEEKTEEAEKICAKIREALDEIKALNDSIEKYNEERLAIAGEWSKALLEIGITDPRYHNHKITDYTVLIRAYKEACKKYQ